jgi:hypothetical protein
MKAPVRSIIVIAESVPNGCRKFGSIDRYFPVWVNDAGEWSPALLSRGQIEEAMLRAKGNPEDVPPRRRSLLERVFG